MQFESKEGAYATTDRYDEMSVDWADQNQIYN